VPKKGFGVAGREPARVEAAAKNSGVQRSLFDEAEFERIFSNRKQRQLLQSDMLALIDQADSGGLQLDIEIFSPVAARSVKGFRLFLKSLKHELARRKKSLNLFVLAEDSAGLYDRKSLMNPDHIVIQGYDAHWKESKDAGPIVLLRGYGGQLGIFAEALSVFGCSTQENPHVDSIFRLRMADS
jgi:hypothetical protein